MMGLGNICSYVPLEGTKGWDQICNKKVDVFGDSFNVIFIDSCKSMLRNKPNLQL